MFEAFPPPQIRYHWLEKPLFALRYSTMLKADILMLPGGGRARGRSQIKFECLPYASTGQNINTYRGKFIFFLCGQLAVRQSWEVRQLCADRE